MWTLSIPFAELILRAVIIYIFLLILLRLTGKRQVGQLSPFDLVLLLVLSNAVQNAMNGGDNSVTAGIVLSVTLVALNSIIGYITYRFKKMEQLVEGRPEILIHDGKLYADVMERARLSHHELDAALRDAGCSTVEEVRVAMLENNGQISVVPRTSPPKV